jgi:hypothetical protein
VGLVNRESAFKAVTVVATRAFQTPRSLTSSLGGKLEELRWCAGLKLMSCHDFHGLEEVTRALCARPLVQSTTRT